MKALLSDVGMETPKIILGWKIANGAALCLCYFAHIVLLLRNPRVVIYMSTPPYTADS